VQFDLKISPVRLTYFDSFSPVSSKKDRGRKIAVGGLAGFKTGEGNLGAHCWRLFCHHKFILVSNIEIKLHELKHTRTILRLDAEISGKANVKNR